MSAATATITFQPESGTPNDSTCHWVVTCPQRGTVPTVTVTALETERDFDFVRIYDGTFFSSSVVHLIRKSGCCDLDQQPVEFTSRNPL